VRLAWPFPHHPPPPLLRRRETRHSSGSRGSLSSCHRCRGAHRPAGAKGPAAL
jgi:hypothetical protein